MRPAVLDREYEKLLEQKRQIDVSLKMIIVKKFRKFTTGNNLLKLSELRLKGGPRDLSSRLDTYLYSQ